MDSLPRLADLLSGEFHGMGWDKRESKRPMAMDSDDQDVYININIGTHMYNNDRDVDINLSSKTCRHTCTNYVSFNSLRVLVY